LALHAWVGVRDLWMDYLTNHYLRLVMHVFTIVWLLGTFTYAIKVLWGL
jgi:succinate dehydrogenase / fumarate reductase membrane anchor subunit